MLVDIGLNKVGPEAVETLPAYLIKREKVI